MKGKSNWVVEAERIRVSQDELDQARETLAALGIDVDLYLTLSNAQDITLSSGKAATEAGTTPSGTERKFVSRHVDVASSQ